MSNNHNLPHLVLRKRHVKTCILHYMSMSGMSAIVKACQLAHTACVSELPTYRWWGISYAFLTYAFLFSCDSGPKRETPRSANYKSQQQTFFQDPSFFCDNIFASKCICSYPAPVVPWQRVGRSLQLAFPPLAVPIRRAATWEGRSKTALSGGERGGRRPRQYTEKQPESS
jgi:hypothetical protein